MAYVYTHTRLDTNEVFYVGIGIKNNHRRAYEKGKRNILWRNIAAKTEYLVDIRFDNVDWSDACLKERELISLYGRRDLNTGSLCNRTNGGEGSNGAIVSEETRRKITLGKTGKKRPPVTSDTRQRLSKAGKGKMPKNFSYLHSPEIVARRIKSLPGTKKKSTIDSLKNKWTSNNPRAKKILNTETGQIFNTLHEALKQCNILFHRTTVSKMLNGHLKNITNIIYA